MKLLIIIAILISVIPVYAQMEAGELLGKKLFLEGREFKVDTIGTVDLAKSVGVDSLPAWGTIETIGDSLQTKGNSLFLLKELQPMTAVLLLDLGYQVVFLSQLFLLPEGYIKVNVAGDSDYESRRYFTHRYWEIFTLDKILPPGGKRADYEITLRFPTQETVVYNGKDEILKGAMNCLTPEGSRRLNFLEKATLHVNIKKRVFSAYVVTKGVKKPSELKKEIGKAMDKLKLDLSYKLPVIEKCETGDVK